MKKGHMTVAKRYATALFQIAQSDQAGTPFEEDVRDVRDVFSNNRELMNFLGNPRIQMDEKKTVVQTAFASTNPKVQKMLLLLLDRYRTDLIPDMADYFLEMANDARGIIDAKVYSIRPLTQQESDTISEVFARKVGKKALRIENIIDSKLLGGIKLRIGNRVFDGTISGKLERLERRLLS